MRGPFFLCLLLTGCRNSPPPAIETLPLNAPRVVAENRQFLSQATFDPWVLRTNAAATALPVYLSDGRTGHLISTQGKSTAIFEVGRYRNGQLEMRPGEGRPVLGTASSEAKNPFLQELDMQAGTLKTGGSIRSASGTMDWPALWQTSDIVIDGDPQAQQVTHSNLFYLLSSTFPGSTHSIPPMGLSSNVYGGHIFWDADVWMLPALLPQHPEYAKPIVAYRLKTLAQAKKNAKMHGFRGAEFAWESADTGAEVAPAEFAKERHITADVGWAAWQFYLWTGDKKYLRDAGWPLLSATAEYWVSRVTKTPDGKYHINGVLSPDETAGLVDDDLWTNGVVRANLQAATRAANILRLPANPSWAEIPDALAIPIYKPLGIPAEHVGMTEKLRAKQADALLVLHPLGLDTDDKTGGRMLDFYAAHTSANGPAMTASIHAVVAARLGRSRQSLDEFRASYQPFMRAPWNAFSEKRTTNNVYFLTGMAGCVQSVLYGFAGLQVRDAGEIGTGKRLTGDGEASLWANPHLPPGWGKLVVQGIQFRGKTLDLTVTAGNKVSVKTR